ncbi:MAG: extensin family protein [Myxococcota bacterium]|nr:extensin family protein [Myxococcota bacterium]
MRRNIIALAASLGCLFLTVQVARAQMDLGWLFGRRGPAYALDGIARRGQDTTLCDPGAMVAYRGTSLRYSSTVRVHPAFAPRLPELERVAIEVATEIYGRAPHRLLHAGAYNCRPVRGRRDRLSEHALGNALDVRGFQFRAMPRRGQLPEGLPRSLRRGFTVTLERHWESTGDVGEVHQRFLRELIRRLAREDVFRVIYGPAHPGHRNHFHFDMSPFRWIHV